MKFKRQTTLYFLMVFVGAGLLLFRDNIQGEQQIVLTVIALIVMMFGLYKVTSQRMSNTTWKQREAENFVKEELLPEEKDDITKEEE